MATAPVVSAPPTTDEVSRALAGVTDQKIARPITELGMVKNIDVAGDGTVRVDVWLTVAGCPMRDAITREVTAAVSKLDGVSRVRVELDVMSEEQRRSRQSNLRGGRQERVIPFAQPDSLTKVYAVASGKGGVGKSSVTVNLAVALAAAGLNVGLLDADIYGHSVPRMLGVTGLPTQVEKMIMPPSAHGVRAISAGMMKRGNEPLPVRGPILHRLLEQFLADVWWGDLDVLLMDLPPGTGDVAISVGQLIPGSDLIVVTTPQLASSEVAERAGPLAAQLHQRVVGAIENMSYLPCPHCGEPADAFGAGGGAAAADTLPRDVGARGPVLGQVPIDIRLREAGDSGTPLVLSDPDSPAARQLMAIADNLASRSRSPAGAPPGLPPA